MTVIFFSVGLLVDEQLSPNNWPLCRVIRIIKGSDNLARVLEVKLGNRIFKRAVTRFCKLPDFR